MPFVHTFLPGRAGTLVLPWILLLGACGGPELCPHSGVCGRDRVCGLRGTCASLRSPEGTRFAGSRWLHPADWGVAGSGESLDDTLPIGGRRGAESLLAFGPLPEASQILRALLVLHPHDPGRPIPEPAEVVVEHVGPFRGGVMARRHGASPLRFAAARRALEAGPARSLRLEVTDAARSAANDHRRLHLLVRLATESSTPVRFASPWHSRPDLRPRLELLVH